MRIAIAFVLLWVGLILESTLFQIPPMDVIHPGFVLVLLILIALMAGPNAAIGLGVVIGIIQDICYGSFIGLNAFTYGLIGYFSGALFKQFLQRNLAITFLVTLFFTFLDEWITYGMTRLFDVTEEAPSFVLSHAIVVMLVNGFLVLMLYPLMARLFKQQERSRYNVSNPDG